ncbi:MAG: hypothetical protein DWC10_01570 [Candidatus Poseidoniales archaeon]|nr:MAG: hypothetical protein DWC10_01570 [Candidatus Poseidoniales archaeon]
MFCTSCRNPLHQTCYSCRAEGGGF